MAVSSGCVPSQDGANVVEVRINVNPPLVVLILSFDHRLFTSACDSHHQKKTGRMEIHVPGKFTAERPAVKLTRLSHSDMSIKDHSLASRLPRETSTPSVQASPEEFLDLSVTPETPLTPFLNSDIPQFNMHIISFKDATIVSLTWPALLGDIMSVASVSEAWSLVMAGRESEVPDFLSAGNEDILEIAGKHPDFQGKHIPEDRRLAGVWFFIWLARYVLDMIRWPTMDRRAIFLPPKTVKKLKAGATRAIEAGLPEAIPSNTDQATAFVGSADVVYAWLVCMVGQATFAPTSRRSTMIGFPVDIRDRAPSISPRAQAERDVWVQNASPSPSATPSTPRAPRTRCTPCTACRGRPTRGRGCRPSSGSRTSSPLAAPTGPRRTCTTSSTSARLLSRALALPRPLAASGHLRRVRAGLPTSTAMS